MCDDVEKSTDDLDLAADGLCVNESCSLRWGEKCPIFRIIHQITAPKVWEIIDTTPPKILAAE